MFRSGFVTIAGRPNVGKSTLLNALLGEKLAITSPKPQTTRRRLQGILSRPDAQVIFVDTPGIHRPRHKLGEKMVQSAVGALEGVDAVILVLDSSSGLLDWDREIIERVRGTSLPVFMVWNKADLVSRDKLGEQLLATRDEFPGWSVWTVSSMNREGLEGLLDAVVEAMPEGEPFYPDDILTDDPERFVVGELIREQVLMLLQDEVPHAVAVEVTDMKDRGEGSREYVAATIFVEKDSQKGIIIGGGGRMLKEIGQRSRPEIENLLGRPVYLDLWVKVKKDWRESEGKLRELGFE